MDEREQLDQNLPQRHLVLKDFAIKLMNITNNFTDSFKYTLEHDTAFSSNAVTDSTDWNDLDQNSIHVVNTWNGQNAPQVSTDRTGVVLTLGDDGANIYQIAFSPDFDAYRTNMQQDKWNITQNIHPQDVQDLKVNLSSLNSSASANSNGIASVSSSASSGISSIADSGASDTSALSSAIVSLSNTGISRSNAGIGKSTLSLISSEAEERRYFAQYLYAKQHSLSASVASNTDSLSAQASVDESYESADFNQAERDMKELASGVSAGVEEKLYNAVPDIFHQTEEYTNNTVSGASSQAEEDTEKLDNDVNNVHEQLFDQTETINQLASSVFSLQSKVSSLENKK